MEEPLKLKMRIGNAHVKFHVKFDEPSEEQSPPFVTCLRIVKQRGKWFSSAITFLSGTASRSDVWQAIRRFLKAESRI